MFTGCKMAASTDYKHRYWASPFCTQGTYMPSSGSFVTMYLAELHFGNGYMDIGLLISTLHGCEFTGKFGKDSASNTQIINVIIIIIILI